MKIKSSFYFKKKIDFFGGNWWLSPSHSMALLWVWIHCKRIGSEGSVLTIMRLGDLKSLSLEEVHESQIVPTAIAETKFTNRRDDVQCYWSTHTGRHHTRSSTWAGKVRTFLLLYFFPSSTICRLHTGRIPPPEKEIKGRFEKNRFNIKKKSHKQTRLQFMSHKYPRWRKITWHL